MPPTLIFPSMTHPASETMRHHATRSLMTHCPFRSTPDEAARFVHRDKHKPTAPKGISGTSHMGMVKSRKKNPKTSPKTKRKHRKWWEVNMFLWTSCISQSKTSHWAHMWLCAWQGRHYWWHIYNRKWFGALWTHSLKRLIDCGGWLTLEGRQPVSLTFSLNLWSFLVRALSEGGKRKIFVLTWESQEVRGTWPHLRCIISNAQKWCLTDDLKVFQLFRLIVKYEVCFVEEGGALSLYWRGPDYPER